MNTDPIVSLFFIIVQRFIIFTVLSVLIALFVWCWLLMSQFDVSVMELITWLSAAWTPEGSKVPAIFVYGALIIGTLATSIFYLLIGCWWKKRARVPQIRGGRLEDWEA